MLDEIQISPAPLILITDRVIASNKIYLYVKRIDQIHKNISGNKWYKLKYNLEKAKSLGYKCILTFGGAYSNHIYATSAACNLLQIKNIGIIRGEEHLPLNPTLSFAKTQGMELHYIDRSLYREKYSQEFIYELKKQFGDFYLIPEGGTNELAVKGCSEIPSTIDIDFDFICTPVGTGGTLAGLICGINASQKAFGFSVLKGGDFLIENVKTLTEYFGNKGSTNWDINLDYHFGGYAKLNDELVRFVKKFEIDNNIQLEPIYTGKMFYGIYDLIRKEYFPEGSKIVALHTGGLQGLDGLKQRKLI